MDAVHDHVVGVLGTSVVPQVHSAVVSEARRTMTDHQSVGARTDESGGHEVVDIEAFLTIQAQGHL